MNREEASAEVPSGDKQAEEDLWQQHKAERGVWSEPMLVALERGLKGNKWFSLIDKLAQRIKSARTVRRGERGKPMIRSCLYHHCGRTCSTRLKRLMFSGACGRSIMVSNW